MYEAPYVHICKSHRKSQGEQSFLFISSLDIFDSMPLLSVWMVTAAGLFGASAALFSSTGNRDAFHVHSTPQIWTASKLCSQLWKNSRFGAVFRNGSKSDLGYAVGHVCWEDNESRHLETCQVANRKDGSLEDEQLDGFSNVVTNSSGAVIGGSCGTGGFILMCVLIYFFCKWLNNDTSVHPANQSGASCPPPPYSHVVRIGECAEPCTFMSKPSTY